VAMNEIVISLHNKLECIDKFCYFGILDWYRWKSRRSIKIKNVLCLAKVQGTGSSANIILSFSQSERKSTHGLCLGICE